ncbi:NAD-dependent epimerase/dehydratase family protein [Lichenicola sp.]|uniref:NAD-dependent epimerase/dehydratase family protein n=1 Tax=Lichenicola sp. TaxID=2804529 RepID=UPI003B0005A6
MTGRHYLVTGGAGFIGSHLCDALLALGHQVRVLDDLSTGRPENLDPRVTMQHGDVSDPGTVRASVAGTDGVFHLAAIASVARGNEDWFGTHRINQGGTVAVLDAARGAGRIPVVYASSAAIYGDTGEYIAREDRTPAPMTAYGADKLGSELHARVASVVHGVPTLGLRFFNVYGPRQDPSSPYSGVISIFARRIGARESITLHGDGTQTRDFVHVADVVAHLLAAMRRIEDPGAPGATGPFNVCTGRPTSIRALAEHLAALNDLPLRFDMGPARAGDIRHSCGSPAMASAALGVTARVELAEGLATLLARD